MRELVADGVHRLSDGVVNWYLVEDGARLTAIDAGFPAAWSQLTATLAELGREPSQLAAVVLTHAHVDHLGFAERARRECGAEVLVHAAEQRLAASPTTIAKSERSPLRYLGHGATRRLFVRAAIARAPLAKGIARTTTFADGETLEWVPGRPRAIHSPGHTDGHCMLHMPERNLLFSGDALVTRDPYTGAAGPRTVAAAATKDPGQALASLDRLDGIEAGLLLPGHGEPWRGGIAEAVRLARGAGRA